MQKPHFDKNTFTVKALKNKIASLKYDKVFRKKCIFAAIELLVLAFILTLDLCMKEYLYNLLANTETGNMTLIEGFLDLTYSVNTGAGFGLFKDNTLGLIIVTAVVIAAVFVYLNVFHTDSEWMRMALVVISAGGLGNLVDRIALGYVRDFFEFTFFDFAIFNVADAFVTIGAVWLVIYLIVMLFKESANVKKSAQTAADEKSALTSHSTTSSVDADSTQSPNGSDLSNVASKNIVDSGFAPNEAPENSLNAKEADKTTDLGGKQSKDNGDKSNE